MRRRRVRPLNPVGSETQKQGMYLDKWTKHKIGNKQKDQLKKAGEGHDQRGGAN